MYCSQLLDSARIILMEEENRKTTKKTESNVADYEAEREAVEREDRIAQMLRRREEAFLEEEKTLLTWKAPSRIFKKRTNEFFTTIGAIVLLVCIILLFIREFLLMIVVIAFSFLAYVLGTVEPEEVENEITTRGVRVNGKFYRWDVLGRYWFTQDSGVTTLIIETYLSFPSQIIMIVNPKDTSKIKEYLSPYVLFEKPELGFSDKASNWLKEKMPLEG